MGFMRVFTTFERFALVTDASGETIYRGPIRHRVATPEGGAFSVDAKPLWYARLSAPGYMDATEWTGGHETEDGAVREVTETYDLCERCHEDHDASAECDV